MYYPTNKKYKIKCKNCTCTDAYEKRVCTKGAWLRKEDHLQCADCRHKCDKNLLMPREDNPLHNSKKTNSFSFRLLHFFSEKKYRLYSYKQNNKRLFLCSIINIDVLIIELFHIPDFDLVFFKYKQRDVKHLTRQSCLLSD